MRYAIISDLHANRQALKAVLTDMRSIGVDEIICLGDFIGYGPSPAEVLENAYANIHHFILGNHDAVIADRLNAECFNDEAKRIIEWTRRKLDQKSGSFFKKLPLILQDKEFCCAHAEFADPGTFNYLFETKAALPSFNARSEKMLFIGHSHIPGIFVLGRSGTPHWLEPVNFGIEAGKRYIINVGSVGQPRDRDLRASYVIFDTEESNVFFRKVPFDIDAYRDDLKRQKLPASNAYFLNLDKQRQLPPLREMVSFRPATKKEFKPRDNDIRQLKDNLRQLKKNNRRLWALSAGLTLLALVVIILSLGRKTPAQEKEDEVLLIPARNEIITPESLQSGTEVLAMPGFPQGNPEQTLTLTPENSLPYWTIVIGDPKTQKVILEKTEGETSRFLIVSENPESEIKIISAGIPLKKGGRVQVRGTFQNTSVKSGFAEIHGEFEAPNGTSRRLKASTVHNLAQLNRWTPRAATCDPLTGDGTVRYILKFKFRGKARVRDCAMILR